MASLSTWENWGRCARFTGQVIQPRCVDEICAAVRSARRVHVVGTGHSFQYPSGPPSDAGGSDLLLLDLTQTMNRVLAVEREGWLRGGAWTCEVEAGCTVGALALELEKHGLALENSLSLTAVTLAGAVLTGSHGSGLGNAVLADLVVNMTVVTGKGEVRLIEDPRLFVHLGLLGVVAKIRVRCVPFYQVSQRVYEGIAFESFLANTRVFAGLAQSVSFWVDLCGGTVTAWLRDPASLGGGPASPELEGFGGRLRVEPMQVSEAEKPILTTATGPWYDLLPYFRPGEVLPNRVSVQAEFFVPFSALPAALRALVGLPNLHKLLPQGCEVRVVKSDAFALSPCHARFAADESIYACIHLTLAHNAAMIPRVVATVEAALKPFGARPHWGKLFSLSGKLVERLYGSETHPDCAYFWTEVRRRDPDAKLRNALFEQIVIRQTPAFTSQHDENGCGERVQEQTWVSVLVAATAVVALGLVFWHAQAKRASWVSGR